MSDPSTLAECSFTENGVFHFKVQFYADELLINLVFEATSSDNPSYFFVNNIQLTSDGLSGVAGICYQISYLEF